MTPSKRGAPARLRVAAAAPSRSPSRLRARTRPCRSVRTSRFRPRRSRSLPARRSPGTFNAPLPHTSTSDSQTGPETWNGRAVERHFLPHVQHAGHGPLLRRSQLSRRDDDERSRRGQRRGRTDPGGRRTLRPPAAGNNRPARRRSELAGPAPRQPDDGPEFALVSRGSPDCCIDRGDLERNAVSWIFLISGNRSDQRRVILALPFL